MFPKFEVFLLLILSVFSFHVCFAQSRVVTNFNSEWKFFFGDNGNWHTPTVDDSDWQMLDLPHDWSIEGNFSQKNPAGIAGGALPGGMGWYRKTFTIPASDSGKSVFIDFDGIYHRSEVWINGIYLGKRPNGYSSFRYDLTPHLRFGEANVIAVKVNNTEQPNSRWYSGSGIYRNVRLVITGKVHIPLSGTFITTPIVNTENATARIQTTVENTSNEKAEVIIKTLIYGPDGSKVTKLSSKGSVPANNTIEVIQQGHIDMPALWSVEKPSLYRADTYIMVGEREVDSYTTSFGIRTFNFDINNGFSLNGKPLKIRGVCNHHDLGALGTAFNVRAAERQLEILKSMGCNAIRTAHNAPAPELLDLADKMGFIVMNEVFDMWKLPKSKFDYSLDWAAWYRRDLEDFIKRDRNHPSVFIWSVGNEIYEQWGEAAKGDTSGRSIARELVSIVQALDTTREIITANHVIGEPNNLIESGAFSMLGFNYHHHMWDNFRRDYPGKKFIVSESTSALATRGHYDLIPFDSIRRWPEIPEQPIADGGNLDHTVSAYDHVSTPWGSTHEESLKIFEKYDHVSGMFVWTGFDYLGEPTPYQWPARSSYFGIMDLAGFPKDTYYLYKSVWSSEDVLHLFPHWNWKEGDVVDMVCYYNNADEVELFLNGKSLGTKKKEDEEMHVKWHVPYQPGQLKAVSRKNGREVLSRTVKTAGVPARIVLEADRSEINADGEDLSFIKVSVVDKDGNLVPDADNLIKFALEGHATIAGVDNGNPTSLEPFKSEQRHAFKGLALAIIKASKESGMVIVKATAEGLTEGETQLSFVN